MCIKSWRKNQKISQYRDFSWVLINVYTKSDDKFAFCQFAVNLFSVLLFHIDN
jgi:hypothetical protein